MTHQEIIDKYLKEFYEVQKLKVPIELNSYLHRMIDEAIKINNVTGQKEQSFCKCGSVKNGGYGCLRTDCDNTLTALMEKELNLKQLL